MEGIGMEPNQEESGPLHHAAVQVRSTREVSEWRIGFTAGIAFALTLLAGPALFFGIRGMSRWMDESQRQASEQMTHEQDPKVSDEFRAATRSLADILENETAILRGSPEQVKAAESDIEDRLQKLSSLAQSQHEYQIQFAMKDVHVGVDSCLSSALYDSKPNASVSNCVKEVSTREEIEKAVNTPYTP